MKILLIVGCLVYFTSVAQAGPLGLDMGMSFKALNMQLKLKKEGKYTYSAKSLPKGHSEFDEYRLLISPKHGLCKLSAFKDVSTSVYGTELHSEFEHLERTLTSKYGQGKKFDFLRNGSIWKEPRDWMMGLLKDERFLMTVWELGERELPDNITSIKLKVFALSTDTAMIELGYEFKNSNDCHDWLSAQEDSVL